MKILVQRLILLLFILLSASVYSQNRITVNLDDFDALLVSGRIDVELIPSDSREMSITSLNGQPEEVSVDFANNELKIKVRPKIDKDDVISIQLPYKSIKKIESLAGAVINSARDLEAEELELIAAAGGKIELSVQTKSIHAKVAQVSDIVLYGTAESQDVTVNTGGNYLAYDLECQDTYISVHAGSQGKVTASRIIDATATSKGYVGYIGDPVSTYTKTSFGGKIASFKTRPKDDEY